MGEQTKIYSKQTDGRMEMALMALFLYQPTFAEAVDEALEKLDETSQVNLKLFYTAAMLLQQIHAKRLCPFLSIRNPQLLNNEI